jgi:hypothetical protein
MATTMSDESLHFAHDKLHQPLVRPDQWMLSGLEVAVDDGYR